MNDLVARLTGRPLAAWLLSVLVGAAALPLLLYGGWIGIVVLAWPALFLWYGRSRLIVVAGMLAGLGLAWLAMVIVGQTEARLVEPALWLAAGVVILAVGLGLSALALTDRGSAGRRPQFGREETIGYFRDLSGRGSGPGVREEDEPRRWGSNRD